MEPTSLSTIRAEHGVLVSLLRSVGLMVARQVPEVRALITRLDGEHAKGESAVRVLHHLLLAWHWIDD